MKKNKFSQVLTIISILIGIFLFSTCELLTPGLGDKVDIEAPVVGIESHRNGDYVGGVVTLTGYASDDAGISSVSATYDDLTVTADLSGEQWSLDFDTSPYPDGDYEVIFSATDSSDKVTSFNLLLVVDNSPPSVLVTSPTEYGTEIDDPEYNKFISIKGEAADTTRVDEVLISLFHLNGTPVFTDEVATGSSSWYYIFDSTTYATGNYYFDVRAVDPSGNSSSYFYHFNDLMGLAVDPGQTPNVEEINAAEFKGIPIPSSVITPPNSLSDIRKITTDDPATPTVDERMAIKINPDSDNPQISIISPTEGSTLPSENIFSSPVSLYGTVQDDDLAGINKDTLKITIFDWDDPGIIIDESTYDGINPNFTLNGNQWTYSTNIDDGEYGVKLDVEDLSSPASLAIPNPVPFTVSSFAPVISMTEPTQGSFVGSGSTITITADISGLGGSSDVWLDWDGDGLYEIEMTEDVPEVYPTPATYSVDITEGSTVGIDDDTLGTPSLETFMITLDGDFTVKVRAGSPGNYGTGTLRLVGDTSAPTGGFNEPLASAQVNGDVTIRGIANDTAKNGETGFLEDVFIHVGTNLSAPLYPDDYTGLGLTYNWNYTFNSSAVADGTYRATIIVQDVAGNYSSPITRDFEVLQASDNPVIEFTNIDSANNSLLLAGNNLLESSAVIQGNIKDDDSFDVSTLNVTIYNSDDSVRTITGQVSDRPSSNGTLSTWEHDISSLPEGVFYAVFTVDDINGLNTTTDTVYFTIDFDPPTLIITDKATLDGTYAGSSGFTLSGTTSDTSGIDHMEISTDGGLTYNILGAYSSTDNTSINWSESVAVPSDGSKDGNHLIRIKTIDNYNRETIDSLTIIYDSTAPTLVLANLVDDQLITSSPFTLLGSWSDNGGSGTNGGAANVEYTLNGGTNWSSLDTISASAFTHPFVLGETLNQSIGFRATDYLGNISAETIVTGLIVDTSIPLLDETTLATASRVLENGILSMEGTASDTLGLSSVTITATLDGADQGEVYDEVTDLANWGPYTLGTGNDGLWIFTITATDLSGRPTSIIREVLMDSTAPSALITSVPATLVNDGASFPFEGTSVDGGSGVEAVRIAFASDGTGSQLAAGKTTWSAIVDLVSALGTEGSKTLYVQVEDKAGNLSEWIDTQQVFVYDTAAPVTVLTEAINREVNGDFSLSGTASDNYGITSISITQSFDGGADIPVSVNGPAGTTAWSLSSLPRDPADIGTQDFTDGTYVYKIISTDSAGKTSTEIVTTVQLDQTAPETLTVTSPGVGQTGLNSLSGAAYTFSGNSSDSGVGMSKIYYLIDQTPTASTTLGDYTDLTTSGNWSFTEDFDTDNIGADTGRAEGKWYIHVLAEDASGNRTDFGSAVTVEFDIDQAAPTLTESVSTIPNATAYYTSSNVSLGGSASDGTGLASVIVSYSKDGAAAVQLLNDTTDDGSWSAIMDTGVLGNGTFQVIISATDGVGKVTSLERNIIIDTVAPVVNFNGVTPVVGTDIVNGTISWSGSTSDETSIDTVQYQLPGGALIDVNNKTNWLVSGIDTTDAAFTEDVYNNLRIVAIDKAGNTADVNFPIYVDQDSDTPTFSYTNVDETFDTLGEASSNLLETGAKIIGTISDDDGVDFNTIEVTVYNSDDSILTAQGPVSNPPAASGTYVNWSHDLSYLTDGVYYVIFTTDDINGLPETTGRVYFTVDLNPAELSVSFPETGSYHSSDFNITGTASDDNGLMHGDHDSDGGAVTAETDYLEVYDGVSWVNEPVASDGTWTHSVSAPGDNSNDGPKSYQIRATDLFGKATTQNLNFTIDTIVPSLTVSNPVDELWTPENTLSINGNSADANGIVSIEVSLDGANWSTVNGTTTWTHLLDISGLAEGENRLVYFRSTDVAGNITSETRNLNIDRTAPTLTETTYGTSVAVYETADYSLDGTLTDTPINSLPTYDHDANGGTAEVPYVEISVNSGPVSQVPVDAVGDWTYPVTFADGTFYYELSIIDNAGNSSSTITRTVIADNISPTLDAIASPTGAELFISGSAYSISGTASDTGAAGLDAVYWWVGPQGNAAPATTSPYTGWTSADGLGTWSDSLDISTATGTGEGDHTLHTFAVDKVGNVSGVSTVDFTIDQAAPIVMEDGLGGTNITSNGDISLELTITETNGIISGDHDSNGGTPDVEYFELMINGSDWAVDAELVEYTGVDMTHTITAAELAEGGNEILIRATDVAGRESSIVKRDVFFDNTPPAVSFINLTGASVVNGETFNIQGTVSDTLSTISSVVIDVDGPGVLADLTDQTVTGSYSWNYNLDLIPAGYYDDGVISIVVTATDSAGNSVDEPLSFAIDQQDDMPTLSLSSLSDFTQLPTAMITVDDNVLAGVLFDADGIDLDSLVVTVNSVVQTPRIINGADNDTAISWFVDLSQIVPNTYTYSVVADDTLANTVSGNFSGMIDSDLPILGSGYKIIGSAEDDDAFDSSSLTLLQNGSDLSGSVTIGSNAIYVPWSYTLPATDDIYYYELNGADATAAAIPVNWSKYSGETVKTMIVKDSGSPVVTVTSPAQGAYVNGSVITSGEAYDDLAINTMTITAIQSDNVTSVELTSDGVVALDQTEGTGEYYYDTAAGKYVWDFALERLPDAYENDSITLVYEAEDIVGNITSRERSITIDTVDPVIAINSPGDGDIVNGNVNFQGTVSDAKLSTVEIKLGTNAYELLSGGYNWTKDVSAATLISYATDNGDDTYNLPVIVRATDDAGNVGLTSAYSITINPDTDKPIVNMTSPANNSTLGGAIMLIGSAMDDDAIDSVELRIDFNGDGDYNDILDLNDDGDTTDDFETETSWVVISNYSNGVWNKEINTIGELYKSNVDAVDDILTGSETIDVAATGAITVQIQAWDINFVKSNVTTLNISLDETFPEIHDFSVTGSPLAISGSFDLQWDIEDNEEIINVAISYDGGLTYTDTIYDNTGNIATLTGGKTVDSDTDLGLGGLSSTVNVRMKAVDNTGYVSFSNLTLNIDNVTPTGVYTGRIEDIGSGDVWVAGTATDTGAVRGIEKIEVYIIQDSNILEPEGLGTLAPVDRDFGDGNVPYTENNAYKIIIDNDDATELEIPEDGYEEYMSIAGNSVEWQAQFDSSNINNSNPLQVHFVVWDTAGNAIHYAETMMMVGTDLDQGGTVDADEMVAYPQGFKAFNLLKVEMDPGSNANLYLYVEHNAASESDIVADGPMAYTIDISGYTEGSTTFDIQVRDSSLGDAIVIQKILNVEIVGADTTPPTVTLNELLQSSINDGHLETNSNYDGVDYDVSGIMTFSAKANDNSRIQTINMIVEDESNAVISNVEIAAWNVGLFEAKNGATFTKNELNWQNGHDVEFTIDWDSAGITGTVDQNVEVRFVATDFVALTGEDSDVFDVVPYISEIETEIGAANPNNPSVVNRSSLGYYPVWSDETVRVKGYNLQPDYIVISKTNDGLNVGDTALAADAVQLNIVETVTAKREYRVSMTNATLSGYLSIISNGFISSINNVNDNGESFNQEDNLSNNNILTDDRRLEIWDFTQIDPGSDIRQVDMDVYNNSVNFSYGHTDNLHSVNVDGTEYALRRSYTRYFDNAITFNDAGGFFSVSQSGDTLGTPVTGFNLPSHFGLVYGFAGDETPSNNWEYNGGDRKTFIESNWNGSDVNKLDRVQNPVVVADGDASLSKVYLSYYDSVQDLLKFRYFEIGTDTASINGTQNVDYYNLDAGNGVRSTLIPMEAGALDTGDTESAVIGASSNGGPSRQGYVAIAGAGTNSSYSNVGFASDGTALVSWYDSVSKELKLKYNIAPDSSYSGYQEFNSTNNPAANTYSFKLTVDGVAANGGNDISVTVPDSTNGSRKYELAYQLNKVLSSDYNAYAEVNPVTRRVIVRSFQTGAASSISITAPTAGTSILSYAAMRTAVAGSGSQWVETVIDSDFAGKYVAMNIDGAQGVHFSYQKTDTGDLMYAFLDSYSDTTPTTVVVDSYLQVGQYTDIITVLQDIDGDGDNEYIPYISYYSISYADTRLSTKISRLNVDPSLMADGVSSDLYNANWNSYIIPARVSAEQYKVNIGLLANGNIVVGYEGDAVIEYGTYMW